MLDVIWWIIGFVLLLVFMVLLAILIEEVLAWLINFD